MAEAAVPAHRLRPTLSEQRGPYRRRLGWAVAEAVVVAAAEAPVALTRFCDDQIAAVAVVVAAVAVASVDSSAK